ncbi:hypothetical protein BZA77DRAFT_355762 [Pyronema omphalodes]|nr:hypothetical protein BZA77DRAFT_355762 [Pyronema omphalodes]
MRDLREDVVDPDLFSDSENEDSENEEEDGEDVSDIGESYLEDEDAEYDDDEEEEEEDGVEYESEVEDEKVLEAEDQEEQKSNFAKRRMINHIADPITHAKEAIEKEVAALVGK